MNILNKFLAYLCLTLSITTASFAYLSYSFYGDKQSAQVTIESLESANKDYLSQITLLQDSYAIGDNINLNAAKTNAIIEAVGQDGLAEIGAFEGCKRGGTKVIDRRIEVWASENVQEAAQSSKHIANIDDWLSDELTRSLSNTFSRLQDTSGGSNSSK